MTPGPLLLVAAAGIAAGVVFGYRSPRGGLALTIGGATLALVAAISVLAGGTEWDWQSDFLIGGERLHLRLDAISAMFLALVGVIGGAGATYAHEYWSQKSFPRSAPRGRCWWGILLLSMGALLLASNGLHFLIAWELFALSGYFLITLDRNRPEVRAAGWLYLAASHAGTLCLFAFFT